ncbi:dipeptide ABC transporter ATP-binding protein [Plantibacter cousiniae (nom. nud.)]|uniref:Peptide/nickel transport system ATP-binding protein n=1 Tax=Plantibacter cousiniae (nom. nud.) TaxID=199709 RepID=A0ABY1LL60_9MICO|nr:ABC transporter ATP-binding protein [Plantibacter cousiniae]SKC55967.1 peptide/nickel transport system ATP-binding protein [Plantibacter cousiniae]
MSDTSPLLQVEALTVGFGSGDAVVSGVSFQVERGTCVAIVGESGSGKSVTARSLLGLAGASARVTATRLDFDGTDLRGLGASAWRRLRGRRIGLVLQDALVSLDPLRPIGREIDDTLRLGTDLDRTARTRRVLELLDSVGMPDPASRIGQRSGELSGGLRQRALIASAIALDPDLLIADEPTTALDVTVQARVIGLLDDVKRRGAGLLLISHDLAVVSSIADHLVVMQHGVVVEQGPAEQLLTRPTHPYTRALIAAVPTDRARGTRLSTDQPVDAAPVAEQPATRTRPTTQDRSDAPALEFRSVSRSFERGRGASAILAVDDVSLRLEPGTTLGVVGESGSGKTTLARIALGLTAPQSGTVLLEGEPWSELPERARRPRRNRLGWVSQDPLSSFDPRWRVDAILADAVRGREAAPRDITRLLADVGLDPSLARARPRTLSGGQRQRVAIARALASRPSTLILDEPVSALDVTVQARILDLLDELQRHHGLSYLLISHDLGVIRHMSDRVAVMQDGRVVEHGDAEQVFTAPAHPYTARLAADAPRLIAPGAASGRDAV